LPPDPGKRFAKPGGGVQGGPSMSDHIYKKIEIVGSSTKGIDDAISNAVDRAGKTLKHLRWFEVDEIRGHIADDGVKHWQVTVKIGFTLEDE